ncbi:uncharacterized protein LOC135103260 [Scylla paramamosain]|uniref:uncharacterized protein LOC135103260 n=1 Tax=Scylla paramamosain TaxID=85552 RepID=UPI0030832016
MNTGAHHTLFNDLCADEKKFFNYFRMSKPSFEELLSYVRRDITGTTTNMRECIAPDEKLDVTLSGKLVMAVEAGRWEVPDAESAVAIVGTPVEPGAYGKSSDSTVFKESKFFRKLENQTLNVPAPQESYSGFGTHMPFIFVADEAFGLSQHIVRPYAGKFLSQKKRIFNYRLSRAHRLIECSFGILANKWRIFHRPLNVSLSLAEDIIKACCVLHNFVRDRDGVRIEDTLIWNLLQGQLQDLPAI